MKKTIHLLLLLLIAPVAFSQNFGADVIIENNAAVDQNAVELTTAFNGWIFAAYRTTDAATNSGGVTIRKSVDGGLTWTTMDSYSVEGIVYESFDLVATGNDLASLRVFVVGVNHSISSNTYILYIDKYDGVTGNFINTPYSLNKGTNRVNDVEIASDGDFPAVGASPYSIGMLYSAFGSINDSIISIVSMDGGTTFPVRQTVSAFPVFSRNVSLTYGRSESASNGRYFAAWEQVTSPSVRTGNIYTSRNVSTVNTSWIPAENLDSLSSSMAGLCRNPRIAVQRSAVDNDSAAVTAVVLVDRDFLGDGSDYDQLGFYNKRAHFTNFWYRLDVNNSGNNDFGGDIIYEDSNDLFHAVYFDSTSRELIYVTQEVNVLVPNSWTEQLSGMNDLPDSTVAPVPRIAFTAANDQLALAWTDGRSNGNGVVKFDSQGFLSVGLNEIEELSVRVYPNPAVDVLHVKTELSGFKVTITDMNGRAVYASTPDQNDFSIQLSGLEAGTYLLRVENGSQVNSQLFVKQ